MASASEASIARIAGAGFRLSLLLNAAACQLAQSRIEIHSIAKGISLFSLTLKHAGQLLDATNLELSSEAAEKAWEIANQGQMVFVEIEHMLDKLQGTDSDEELRRIPVQERLKWCFRKQHVTYLLAHLESLKLSLIVILQILQLGEFVKLTFNGVDNNSLGTEDGIAQEKAETQNMIIVRYWSLKRLDRLWDLVEQEALEAASDPTCQKINSNHFSSTASAVSLVAAATASKPTKLHMVTFGDVDLGLSDIEQSPKDMVHLSDNATDRLLLLWAPTLDSSLLNTARNSAHDVDKPSPPRVYVSSENEDSDPDSDSPKPRGYYLEGNTVDWRKPQSQEARQHAAELRRRYSSYQAHVEDDLELDKSSHCRKARSTNSQMTDSSDEGEQRSNARQPPHFNISGTRRHANSLSSRHPLGQKTGPSAYPSGFSPPIQKVPRSQRLPPSQSGSSHVPGPQPPYKYYPNQDHNSPPRSVPMGQPNPSGAMPIPSPRGTPPTQDPPWTRSQGYNNSMLQPRHHPSAYPLSSSSPGSSFRHSPPRSVQRSPSRPNRRSSHEEAKERERHKSLTRNATRGLAGIGAIAGFMDALEAFSLL
ncbi:uncharacterized protein N7459_002686 [Penicillium hispanicum]|uniref:uncharacterized protein n=1 Tax=Penicillium hispanicum TaxID=1080232 RepID=UPI0025418C3E|nr:uncharacterized protein N7459_002686 [Penicillium hispanicum]KAJ5586921.1 hypothetical protein N7459_002686 [Penicillium hispanicum]